MLRTPLLDKLEVRGLHPPVVGGDVVRQKPVDALAQAPVPEVEVGRSEVVLALASVDRVAVHAGSRHTVPSVHGHLGLLVFLDECNMFCTSCFVSVHPTPDPPLCC